MASIPNPNLAAESHASGEKQMHDLEHLVAVALQGDASAFGELYQHFFPRLVRFIEQRLDAHQKNQGVEPEDVAQETLTKAWRKLEQFDRRYRFSTWLYTIAVRTTIDHARSAAKSGKQTRSAVRSEAAHEILVSALDRCQSPDVQMEEQETRDNLWQVARQVLSNDQFSAMWLRYAEELSVKEVAKVLRKTAVGIKVTLHRSRQALQPHLLQFASSGPNASDNRISPQAGKLENSSGLPRVAETSP